MSKLQEMFVRDTKTAIMLAKFLTETPPEMFWAYEALRQSGVVNMFIFDKGIGRYASDHPLDIAGALNLINDIYMKYIILSDIDLPKEGYVKMTLDHIAIFQRCYPQCLEHYGQPKTLVDVTYRANFRIGY